MIGFDGKQTRVIAAGLRGLAAGRFAERRGAEPNANEGAMELFRHFAVREPAEQGVFLRGPRRGADGAGLLFRHSFLDFRPVRWMFGAQGSGVQESLNFSGWHANSSLNIR